MSNQDEIDNMSAEELRAYYKNFRLKEGNLPVDERIFLLEKYVFADGDVADAYSIYIFKNKWHYICHVCDLKGKNWKSFRDHVYGKQHRQMQSIPVNTKERFGIRFYGDNKSIYLKGGWVEDSNTLFTKATAGVDVPLIGTEYLVELVDKQPLNDMFLICETADYVCLLCDVEGDYKTIRSHLSSPEHCWTYLDKFFPKAVKKIETLNVNDELKQKLMEHVVAKVEFVYGRIKVNQVVRSVYQKYKQIILEKVERCSHLREMPNQDFTDCVDISHLKPKKCRVGWLNRIKDMKKGGKPQLQVPPPMTGPPPFTKRRRLALAKKFREEDSAQKKNDTRSNQTHTDRRSVPSGNKTLTGSGPDKNHPNPAQFQRPQNSNMQPSGSNLPYQGSDSGPQENFTSTTRSNDGDRRMNSWSNEDRNIRPRSPEPYQGNPKTLPSQSSSSFKDNSSSSNKLITEQNKKPGILSILRTLAVLESELGTLGPRAIDLLKEAIFLEKSTVNGADILITREENLLETIKEKLVGLLDSQIINQNLIAAAKDVVAKIEFIIAPQLNKSCSSGDISQSLSEATYGQNNSNQSGSFSNYYGNNSQSSQLYKRRPNNFDQSPGNYNRDSRWSYQEKRLDNSLAIRDYSHDNFESHHVRDNSMPTRDYSHDNFESHHVRDNSMPSGDYSHDNFESHHVRGNSMPSGDYSHDNFESHHVRGNSMPNRDYSHDNYKAHRDRYTSNSKPYDRFQNRKY